MGGGVQPGVGGGGVRGSGEFGRGSGRRRAKGEGRGVRVRVTELVEPVLVLSPFLGSRVDLLGLAAASKQQHARNGEKAKLRRGALDLAEVLVHDTHGCEGQAHKV